MNTEPASTLPEHTESLKAAPSFDEPYTWARPTSTYLSPREVVRLTIVRSRMAEREDLRTRLAA